MIELRLEIKDNAERIDKLCNLLKQNNTKLRKIKEMNYAEKRKERIINENQKVETMNANYPMLEVVDENTIIVNGVQYQKVEQPKPQTLKDIIREWIVIYNIETDSLKDRITNDLMERIETKWLPNDDPHDGEEYQLGWNACLEYLRKKLK